MIFPPLGGFFMGETLSCDTGPFEKWARTPTQSIGAQSIYAYYVTVQLQSSMTPQSSYQDLRTRIYLQTNMGLH